MAADSPTTEQAQQAAAQTVVGALSSVDVIATKINGLSVGDSFSAPASLTTEAKAVGAGNAENGSALANLRAFGLTLEDLVDESTGEAVRSALTTGTGANLSSTVKVTAESSSSSVDGTTSARTKVDTAGVQADQAKVELGGTASVAASVVLDAGASASAVSDSANAYLDISQATGLDFSGGDTGDVRLDVGNNLIASGAVSADFLAAAESAADDATATAAIDRLLGADVEQLLVGGSSRIDGNTNVTLGINSSSQTGSSSSIADAATILGLNLDEAAGSGDLNGVGGALLLNNKSDLNVSQTSTSSRGDSSASAAFNSVGGINLGDVDTGAQLVATNNSTVKIDQSAQSSGGDVEVSSQVNDVYGLQQEGFLETGGSTTITSNLEVESKRVAQAVAGAHRRDRAVCPFALAILRLAAILRLPAAPSLRGTSTGLMCANDHTPSRSLARVQEVARRGRHPSPETAGRKSPYLPIYL